MESVKSFSRCFDWITSEGKNAHASQGCFCINTMVELAPHEPKFAVLTREHQMYCGHFQRSTGKGQQNGELAERLNAGLVAQGLVVSMIGLTVLMKSGRTFVHQPKHSSSVICIKQLRSRNEPLI